MIAIQSQAVQCALTGDWEKAISLNLEALKLDPEDIESLNRLAYAYTMQGKTNRAKEMYKKVLDLDAKNPIALKNLKRLRALSNGTTLSLPALLQHKSMFLEETGKTKVIELINVAETKVTSLLRTGEYLALMVKRSHIFLLDAQKQYIGMLPDDITRRLIKFVDGGNKYEVYVKAIENNKVTIFMKEIKRAARFRHQPSFSFVSQTTKPKSAQPKEIEMEEIEED